MDSKSQIFFALLQAGLWEKDIRLLPFGEIDYETLQQLSEEQSVVGIVAAGLEHVVDTRPAKKDVVQFIGRTIQLEQRNSEMNSFIGSIADKMRKAGISFVLVKGQGIAQCYERPQWRSSGDIDLLLDEENYQKAKVFLLPLSSSVDNEDLGRLHQGLTIDSWRVELHGTMHSRQLMRMNNVLDEVQRVVFEKGRTRLWANQGVTVSLPAPNEDVFFVFAHILQHYFGGGIGLRQICDWCRLLFRYHESLDVHLLERRLHSAGIMTEWKAFAAMAVDWLGMPVEAMPLFSSSYKWTKKSSRMMSYVLQTGNLGHKRDKSSRQKSFLVRSADSLLRYSHDTVMNIMVFPKDSLLVWWRMVLNGVRSAVKGKWGH